VADPLFFTFFGVVSMVGSYYVQAASTHDVIFDSFMSVAAVPRHVWALSLPIGALTTNILIIIDDIRDRQFDIAKGQRTVAVRFGKHWSRAEFVTLLLLSYCAPFWF
jgi:1,4-dihydroxy-2-naphthoate octaprenyltransferase